MAKTLERPTAEPIILPDSAEMPRKLWTVEECCRLTAMGLLEEGGRYELLAGEIVDKMSFSEPHVYVAAQVYRVLMAIFGFDFVRQAAPITLSRHNGPEPDVAVMLRRMQDYLALGTPPASDVRLAVEVADATLNTDRAIKAPLYSAAGIPEYWIINIPERQLDVFRQPTADGYAERLTVAHGGTVSPLAASEARIAVAEMLP